MTAVGRVALAARVFALAATISVAALQGGSVLRGALVVLVIAAWAQIFSLTGRVADAWVAVVEGMAVAATSAAAWPHNDAVTPYLVLPALIGGMAAGWAGALRVLGAEAAVLSLSWWLIVGELDRTTSGQALTWLLAGLGLGLLGVAFRRAVLSSSTEASYRSALELIKQLHALSGKLTAGLDAVSLAERVMESAGRRLPIVQAMVLVRGDAGVLSPLRFSDGASTEALLNELEWVTRCWDSQEPAWRGHRLGLPLCTESHTIALLVADCASTPDARAVKALTADLETQVVQLYAALLFGDVRDAATSDERQRLAREVHDGVAQDVASLGYVVDSLVDNAEDPEQLDLLQLLRKEVTRVVTELRHSVFDLRNDVGTGQGLGQSLSSFARHVGSHSDLTVHVTLNEAATRLRPDIESELLRIAQEAINNARKHSGGQNLWVRCAVQPPEAWIEVCDDGHGLGPGREDSHGLRIMRERAEKIGAELQVAASESGGGTRVFVRVPARVRSLSEA